MLLQVQEYAMRVLLVISPQNTHTHTLTHTDSLTYTPHDTAFPYLK